MAKVKAATAARSRSDGRTGGIHIRKDFRVTSNETLPDPALKLVRRLPDP
jgi:hypothetical protein